MAFTRKMKDLTADPAPTLGASGEKTGKIITDAKLAASISKAGNNAADFNATVVQSDTVYG